jgi:predicted nucleic acid-binding protein
MQKIMLDTNEYDRLLAAQDAYDMLLGLLFKGRIQLLSTHIQRDEILAVSDVVKKSRLESLLAHAHMIATRGIVLGVSRFGLAKYGSDEDHRLIEHVRGSSWKRKTNDALIAATAARDADVFVTDDRPLMQRLSNYPGIQCAVIDFDEFKVRLTNL